MEHIYKNSSIFYQILGEGNKLIVLLHGWGADHSLMLPLYYKISQYNSSFKYLFIDFPPFGKSSEPFQPWNLEDYVNLTKEIIQKIDKVDEINIIGHSFGGRVGIKLCSKLDLKVDKLILLASAGIKPRFSLKTKIKLLIYKFYKKIGSKKTQRFGSKDYKMLSPIMKKTFNNIINENLRKYCRRITAKTLIIWGKKDKETPFYMAKILNKNIKNSRLITVKKGDHFAYIYYLNCIFPILNSFLLAN